MARSFAERCSRALAELTPRPILRAVRELAGTSPLPSFMGNSGFRAGMPHRGPRDWPNSTRDINWDARVALRVMRARARWLEMNEPLAKQHFRLLDINVLGPNGITSRPKVRKAGELWKEANVEIKARFDAWAAGAVTVDRRWNLRQVDGMALRRGERDGEELVRLVFGKQYPCGLAIQLINPDLLDERYNRDASRGKNEIRMGVEVDEMGAPLGFWPFTRKSANGIWLNGERYFVPAWNEFTRQGEMLHYFMPLDSDQTRGVSEMHAAMIVLHKLGAYSEAALDNARVGANQVAFIEQDLNADDVDDPADPEAARSKLRPVEEAELDPGTMWRLRKGEKVSPWTPSYPNGQYESFVEDQKHDLAMGLGEQFFELAGKLNRVNYTSSRTGKLTQWDVWRTRQKFYIDRVRSQMYRAWIVAATLSGELKVGTRDILELLPAKHSGRNYDWVDPLRDSQAGVLQLSVGMTSLQRLLPGEDIEEIFEEQAEAYDLAKQYGLNIAPPASAAADAAKLALADELANAGQNGSDGNEAAQGREQLVQSGSNHNGRHSSRRF